MIVRSILIRHLFHPNNKYLIRTISNDTVNRLDSLRKEGELRRKQRNVFTVPNILTFSRMAVTPACGYFIWNGMHTQAFACFAFAAVTDLLDGLIARTFNQQSDIGTLIDPIADKLLLTTCLVTMYNTSLLPLWLVKGLVFRDLAILTTGTAIRYHGFKEKPSLSQFFDFKNYPTLGFDPTFTSKCCTTLQCLVIGLTLSTQHMTDLPYYAWSMFGLQVLTSLTGGVSLGQYMFRLMGADPFRDTRPIRSKG